MATRRKTKKEETPAVETPVVETPVAEEKPKKKPARRAPARKKKPAENAESVAETVVAQEQLEKTQDVKEEPKQEVNPASKPKTESKPKKEVKQQPKVEPKAEQLVNEQKQEPKPEKKPQPVLPPLPLPAITIRNIVELQQAPQRAIVLSDQQIQMLTLEDIEKRHLFLQQTLANVLDYDVVISDTNIWLELLLGHTSNHSDPKVNARLQFERQLEFISKLVNYRGGRFIMMAETYEEIDRFACLQDPTNHKEADFTDNIVCLNAAARLAKRLILAQQRENRLRIDGIGAESHHAAFADPAIIRRVAELFAQGKKVLLMTNDASVAIRAMGICDDLQRHNAISDKEWDDKYAPLRPMVFTFDDLRLLDNYTRQYHYIQMAAGKPWMCNIAKTVERTEVEPLSLEETAFARGDKRKSDNLNIDELLPRQQKVEAVEPKIEQKSKPRRHRPSKSNNENKPQQQENK